MNNSQAEAAAAAAARATDCICSSSSSSKDMRLTVLKHSTRKVATKKKLAEGTKRPNDRKTARVYCCEIHWYLMASWMLLLEDSRDPERKQASALGWRMAGRRKQSACEGQLEAAGAVGFAESRADARDVFVPHRFLVPAHDVTKRH
jgi:hypothetical protein